MSQAKSSATHASIRHGLLSLLTVVIVLSLATAAVLAITTARAMSALANRQATMTTEGYDAERSAQATLAALDDLLAQAQTEGLGGDDARAFVDMRMDEVLGSSCVEDVSATYMLDGDVLVCTFVTTSGRMLETQVVIDDDVHYQVASWKLTVVPEEEDMGGNLWTGSMD